MPKKPTLTEKELRDQIQKLQAEILAYQKNEANNKGYLEKILTLLSLRRKLIRRGKKSNE